MATGSKGKSSKPVSKSAGAGKSRRATPSMRELAQWIGRRAWWSLDGLSIAVTVVDVRASFGRVDVAITPIGGTGEKWVDAESLHMTEDVPASR